ncbi:DUF3019 domain-containing protein [Agaribacter marinus]|uniref:DUF3019 domain-containing protein n=1 Tax=Agaribacter marinus TaxID=1431249 RepID=UPI0024E16EFA|nr:DUF3019 domain-containing protein [Agaribacter marinus]
MGYKPQLYILILCISIVFSARTDAQQNKPMVLQTTLHGQTFSLSPTTCVTNKNDETCQMDLHIVLEDSSIKENVCIFLSGTSLGCWFSQTMPEFISVKLLRAQQLVIKEENGKTLFSQTLFIKYIEPIKKRRRINNPWSIF